MDISIPIEPFKLSDRLIGLPLWYWILIALLGIGAFRASRIYFVSQKKQKNQGTRDFLQFLRWISRFEPVYLQGLGRCLHLLDGWLGETPIALSPATSSKGWRRWFGSNPWTGGLYDLCLKLAVLYPIFALLGFWILANQGMLGEVVFLESLPSEQRAVAFAGMVLTIGLFVYSGRRQGWRSWLAFAVAVALAVVAALLYEWLLNQYPKISPVVRGIFWWVVLIAYAGLLYQLGEQSNEGSNVLLLFLGVLPLLNAPLDWLSLGLTRGLLRAVFWRAGSWYVRLGISVVDLVIAFSLMFGLVAVVITGVSALNYFAIAGGGAVRSLIYRKP